MAIQLPPPPVGAAQDSRAWTSWYAQLQSILTTASGLVWALIDKTGSRLSDIVTRPHSDLTGILGAGPYHMTSADADTVTILRTRDFMDMQNQATDPTILDFTNNRWGLYKNTTTGVVKLWVKDSGTMKSVTLS